METQKFSCFSVMQKELAHLRVSALHLTHNPISVSSQSLSDISTKFFFSTFPYLQVTFSAFIPSQISVQCFHTIYKEETSVAFSSPHSLLRLPSASPTEGGKPHFEGRFEILIKSLVSFWMTSFFPLQRFQVDFTLWLIFAKGLKGNLFHVGEWRGLLA